MLLRSTPTRLPSLLSFLKLPKNLLRHSIGYGKAKKGLNLADTPPSVRYNAFIHFKRVGQGISGHQKNRMASRFRLSHTAKTVNTNSPALHPR